MKLPATVERFQSVGELTGPLHLAIGMFDGVHLGHLAVIESAVFSANHNGGVSGVLTFDPHPSRLFRPEDPTRLIMPIDRKCARLHSVGVGLIIRKQFDRAYASLEADQFAEQLKSELPHLQAVYVGENFRFGKARSGDVALLVETGRAAGLDVISVPRVQLNGLPISSTRIREALRGGAIERVNELLGYHYFSDGRVTPGAALGRTIGFPTMNLPWEPDCLPLVSVCMVYVSVATVVIGCLELPTMASSRRWWIRVLRFLKCTLWKVMEWRRVQRLKWSGCVFYVPSISLIRSRH